MNLERAALPGNLLDRVLEVERRLDDLEGYAALPTVDPAGEGDITYVEILQEVDIGEGPGIDITGESPEQVVGLGGDTILRHDGSMIVAEYDATQTGVDEAMAAASSGDSVELPPGEFDWTITLKDGVRVVEQVAGTVVLNSSSSPTVTTVSGGYISVKEIRSSQRYAPDVVAVAMIHATGDCEVRAELIYAESPGSSYSASNCYAIHQTGAGTLHVYGDCQASAPSPSAHFSAYGIYVAAGTLYVDGDCRATQGSSQGYVVGVYIPTGGGDVFVHGHCSSDGGWHGKGAYVKGGTLEVWGDFLAESVYNTNTCYGVNVTDGTVKIHGNAQAYAGTVNSITVSGVYITGGSIELEGNAIGKKVAGATGTVHGYGACAYGVCTLTMRNGEANGQEYDLYQGNGATLQVFGVDHITHTGTITWLDGDALESLRDYARGSVIRGGAADWEAYSAKTDKFVLVGDGTDVVSRLLVAADIPAAFLTETEGDARYWRRRQPVPTTVPAGIEDGDVWLQRSPDVTAGSPIGLLLALTQSVSGHKLLLRAQDEGVIRSVELR